MSDRISRRRFLKASGALAGFAALSSLPGARFGALVDSVVKPVEGKNVLEYLQREKGLMYDPYVIWGNLAQPTVQELLDGKFTLVGTEVKSTYTADQLEAIQAWVGGVKSAGIRTIAMITEAPNIAKTQVSKAVSMGFDVLEIDEPIPQWNITSDQLHQIIADYDSIQIIVTEYGYSNIGSVYDWTAGSRNVRVATDDYNSITKIDRGVQKSAQYGKLPMCWLIFIKSSPTVSRTCYFELPTWIQYAKDRGVDRLYFRLDRFGYWKENWRTLMSDRT